MRYEDLLAAVQILSPSEKARLIEDVSAALRRDLGTVETPQRRSLFGLWEGEDVSAEDIDAARRDMWGDFPREDI
jgi:hypothetical protein